MRVSGARTRPLSAHCPLRNTVLQLRILQESWKDKTLDPWSLGNLSCPRHVTFAQLRDKEECWNNPTLD